METSTVLFIPSASSAHPELASKIRPYPTAQTTTGASVTIRLLFRFSFTAFSGSGAGLPGRSARVRLRLRLRPGDRSTAIVSTEDRPVAGVTLVDRAAIPIALF